MKEREAKKLRIAMLSVHSSPLGELGSRDTGGMSVYIRELAIELAKSGHCVDIFTRSDTDRESAENVLYDNVRLITLKAGEQRPVPKESLYRHLPDFFQALENYRCSQQISYDLVHSHYWLSGEVGRLAGREWGVPHVLMYHTTGVAKNTSCREEQEPAHRLAAEKVLAQQCTRIIAPTAREKKSLMENFSVPESRIRRIPCGVNLEQFVPSDRQEARQRIGIDHNGLLVLYVGRFALLKGLDRLIDAAALELKKGVDLKLVIVGGDGKQSESSLERIRQVRTLGIERSVIFTGRIAHELLPAYYSAADVLAVPSHYESFGLVALEALACGTPVIASPVGNMDSVIRDHETGILVEGGTPEQFAGAISTVISGRRNGFKSRNDIRNTVTDYSWKSVAASVLEEYRGVLHEHGQQQSNAVRTSRAACG